MTLRCDDLSERDENRVDANARLPAPLVYEIVRRDGVEEMTRPLSSLTWSGIAAGICISFSVVAEAMFRVHLPDADWRPLVENLGYSVGFLIVILGRMQLFTENTITTVLPTMSSPTTRNIICSARVWSVVFGANLVGALVAALFLAYSGGVSEEMGVAIREISLHAVHPDALAVFVKGIPAGILIAAIVWMLPTAQGTSFFIVLFFTYLIALGDFTHVVAGSVEAIFLLIEGDIGALKFLAFVVPAFFGNVVGGTVVFALLAYGQVADELPADDDQDITETGVAKEARRTSAAE